MAQASEIQVGQRVEVVLVRGGGYVRDSSIYEGGQEVTKVGTVTEHLGSGPFASVVVDFDDGDHQVIGIKEFAPDYQGGFPTRSARLI